jgi:adenine deaminase
MLHTQGENMSVSNHSTSKEKMISVMNVALGKENADLAIINGYIVNVYTG